MDVSTTRSAVRALIALTAFLSLGACSSSGPGCQPGKGYSETAPTEPLRAPDGLDLPDTGDSVPVPGGPRALDGKDAEGRCLEEPPNFFAKDADEAMEGMPVAEDPGVVEGVAIAPDPSIVAAPGTISGASVLANEVAVFLAGWSDVWSRREPDAYFSYYENGYYPAGYDDSEEWQTIQRERFLIPANTEILVDSVTIETTDSGSARAEFIQRFGEAPNYRSVQKEMELTQGGAHGWSIRKERIIDVL